MPESARVLLLDRDGVLNHDRPDYVQSIDQLQLLPGVLDAMRRLHAAGVIALVITNQACVGKGLISRETLETIHERLSMEVAAAGGRITGYFLCTHRNEDRCDCRKPAPGLIVQAQQAWGFDPAVTWMVGDAERDVLAAEAAGCRPALVRTGKGEKSVRQRPDVPAFADLAAFVDAFLGQELT
ncbi:MAG: HAD-IIIA family hydrolase [Magnetococcales bacterium]|nr:HAD-IIIA family hydrolase [Magnetococcales bacterium]